MAAGCVRNEAIIKQTNSIDIPCINSQAGLNTLIPQSIILCHACDHKDNCVLYAARTFDVEGKFPRQYVIRAYCSRPIYFVLYSTVSETPACELQPKREFYN